MFSDDYALPVYTRTRTYTRNRVNRTRSERQQVFLHD